MYIAFFTLLIQIVCTKCPPRALFSFYHVSGILHLAIFRFKYNCFYELDSLAVVNVRDLGGIKHTFKLLVPEARLFQCANAEAKKVSGATSVFLHAVSLLYYSSTTYNLLDY